MIPNIAPDDTPPVPVSFSSTVSRAAEEVDSRGEGVGTTSHVPPNVVFFNDESDESSLTGRLTEVAVLFKSVDVSFNHGNNPTSPSSGHGYNDPSSFSHQADQGNDSVASLFMDVVVMFTTVVVMFVVSYVEFDANSSSEGDIVGLTYILDVSETLNESSVDSFTGASDDNSSCEASKVGSRLADDNISPETGMVGSIVDSIMGLPVLNSINGVGIIV